MKQTVGMLLAGGSGSRLFPMTSYLSKHLLPVYDKPMIYYSLSTLMLAGIKDIALISNYENIEKYKILLGNGSTLGINLFYYIQNKPNGIAESFYICEDFIKDKNVYLHLADNIFFGNNFQKILDPKKMNDGCTIFTFRSKNAKDYGVLKLNNFKKPKEIIEKPKKFISDMIVTGLYFFKGDLFYYLKKIKKSQRGELEITDLNNEYLKDKKLNYKELGRGFTWIDAGTHEKLLEASNIISRVERNSSFKIGLPEEIAYRKNLISKKQFIKLIEKNKNTDHKKYLKSIIDE